MKEKIKKHAESIGLFGSLFNFLGTFALLYSSIPNYGSFIEPSEGKKYYSLFLDLTMLRIGIALITLGFFMQIIERVFNNNENLDK